MIEGAYLWQQFCEAADPVANVAELSNDELGHLSNFIKHLMHLNGGEMGVPGLCMGLVDEEAARRFLAMARNTSMEELGININVTVDRCHGSEAGL